MKNLLVFIFLLCSYNVPASVIQGHLFYDDNMDGCRNQNEEPSKNIVISLFKCIDENPTEQGLFIFQVTSNDNGFYLFEDNFEIDSSYYLEVSQSSIRMTNPSNCSLETASDFKVDGKSNCVQIFSQDTIILNGGLIPRMGVGGTFFIDNNANSNYDFGEKDISEIVTGGTSIIIELLDVNGDTLASTSTDFRGKYFFQTDPGEYYLQFVPPSFVPGVIYWTC